MKLSSMLLGLVPLQTLAEEPTLPTELVFARSHFATQTPDQLISLVDMTGDGVLEMLHYTGFGFEVRRFDASGVLEPKALDRYGWEGESVAWTLVDLEGDGSVELVTLEAGEKVLVHRLRSTPADPKPRLVHETLLEHRSDIPSGIYRMDFLRDIDGDGRQDLVLPQLGSFAIFLQEADGSWAAPFSIQYKTRVELEVGSPEELGSDFGQSVQVPWFELRDVDGDGLQDLVSETEDAVRFHLGNPKISPLPSWTLDLAALRAELPADEGLDYDNLLGIAARGVGWRLADLDGQVPHELILRVGSKFRVYRSGSRQGASGAPDQLLKSSGNVLYYVLRDVVGDPAPELQLLRGEKIGLSQVIRWLVIPGSIDFDVFTYENQAGQFSRRPTRRNKLTLGIPRILAFADRMKDMEEHQKLQLKIPAQRIALGADGRADDILDALDHRLTIHLNSSAEEPASGEDQELSADAAIQGFLEHHVDELGPSGSKSFDLGDVEEWVSFAGAELRAACAGREADASFELEPGLSEVRIRVLDINHNGRPDFIVLGHPALPESDSEASPLWSLHFFVH